MAHVEDALGHRLGGIETADHLGTAGIFDLQLAARHPVDLGGEEVVDLAPHRLAVDERDIAQLVLWLGDRREAGDGTARSDGGGRRGLDEFSPR